MPQPFESKEFLDYQNWREKSRNQMLNTSDCISTWTDICGFGSLLEENNWDLKELQKKRILELLNEVYTIAGTVFLPNEPPFPTDKILILNDGVAKTIDLKYKKHIDTYSYLFFLRDTFINHYLLLNITKEYNVGIRTILAGGERIQYSPEKMTGHSILYYDENNVSERGKKILETQFLYNPAEFQMNTAFAKAFTIDTMGTKEGIIVNGLFVEKTFIDLMSDIPNLNIDVNESAVNIYFKKILMFKLTVKNILEKTIKGLDVKIFEIDKLLIYKDFDGDDLVFKLFQE